MEKEVIKLKDSPNSEQEEKNLKEKEFKVLNHGKHWGTRQSLNKARLFKALIWEWQSVDKINLDKNINRRRQRLKRTIVQFRQIIEEFFGLCLGYESIYRDVNKKKLSDSEVKKSMIMNYVKRGEILPKESLYIKLGINKEWINRIITNPSEVNRTKYILYHEAFMDALELLKAILFQQALNNPTNFAAIKWYMNVAFNVKEDISTAPNQPILLHFNTEKGGKSIIKFNNNIKEFAKQKKKT